jgi:hypothetical protein
LAQSQYFHTFGLFIDHFAHLESYLAWFLRETAGIDKPTARAVFSGVRVETAVSHIRRIYEARETEIDPLLASALTQVSVLNGLRNDLVHHPLTYSDPRGPLVSTKLVAHTPAKVRMTITSTRLLQAAILDLHQIGLTLLSVALAESGGQIQDDRVRRNVAKELRHAWRYRPQPQEPNRRTPRDTQLTQPHQRKASQA